MLITGVEDKLCVLDARHECASGVDVAAVDEERVGVGAVHLHRYADGPPRAELGNGEAALQQQCALGPLPCLGEELGREHAERDACVDDVGRQFPGRRGTPRGDLPEPDLPHVSETAVNRVEPPPGEEVRRVHGVPFLPQSICQVDDTVGQALHVVEEEDLGHRSSMPPVVHSTSSRC